MSVTVHEIIDGLKRHATVTTNGKRIFLDAWGTYHDNLRTAIEADIRYYRWLDTQYASAPDFIV